MSRPTRPLMSPFSMFFDEIEAMIVRPKIAIMKFSSGPKRRENSASGGAIVSRATTEATPPQNELMAAS